MTEKGLIDGMNAIINGQTNFESDNPKISKPSFESQPNANIATKPHPEQSNPKVQDYLFKCELAKQELLRNKDDYGWGDQEVKIVENFFQNFAQKLVP